MSLRRIAFGLVATSIISGCTATSQGQPLANASATPQLAATASSAPVPIPGTGAGLVGLDGKTTLDGQFKAMKPLGGDPPTAPVSAADGVWTYIRSDGTPAFPGNYEEAAPFSGEVAVVKRGGKYGAILFGGVFGVEPKYDYLDLSGFHDGLCEARDIKEKKSAFIDPQGNVVIPFKAELYECGSFQAGLIHHRMGAQEVFLDTHGLEKFRTDRSGPFLFGDGLWLSGKDKKTFLNEGGSPMFGTDFLDAEPFSEGLAAVKTEKGWGVIDKSGKFVIKPQYEQIHFPTGKYLAAQQNGKWGLLDLTGNTVFPFAFEGVGIPVKELVPVKLGGLWGLMNLKNELIVQPRYRSLHPYGDGAHFIYEL